MIVLDTNVISELMKPEPEISVRNWVYSERQNDLTLASPVIAEILFGIALLPLGKRRNELALTAQTVLFSYEILPFGEEAAVIYARLASDRKRKGKELAIFDMQIASIALANGAAIATRNVRDFEGRGLILINPWTP